MRCGLLVLVFILSVIFTKAELNDTQHCTKENATVCQVKTHSSIDGEEGREGLSEIEKALQDVLKRLKSTIRVTSVLTTGNASEVDSELTVLSALMDIGIIPETDVVTRKDPALYFEWLRIFSAVTNPLIFVTDRNSVAWRVIEERRQRPTVVIVVEKYSTWAFGQVMPRYAEIFDDPNYPKLYPNTIYPEYACVNHGKYEYMQVVSEWNYFTTPLAAWVDAGIYRFAVESGDFRPFEIKPLKGFDPSKLTVNQIREPKYYEDNHRFIMKYGSSIIGGGYWLGTMDVMRKFSKDYMNFVEVFIGEGLGHCDEQVLASMFLPFSPLPPAVEAQFYQASAHPQFDKWFALAHITRERGLL